ncbi:MAG: hypothetical protein IPM85_16980 [Chitinophagaceae bacterium]|nr:hypothetical protein [Chitinophagaceae bacterium]
MTDKEKLQILFEHYLAGTCSAEEKFELAALAGKLDNNTVSSLLKGAWETHIASEPLFSPAETEVLLAQIIASHRENGTVVSIFRRRWFRVAAVAVFIVAIAGGYLLLKQSPVKDQEIIVQTENIKHIAPGGNKATLILADGSVVILDTAHKGELAGRAIQK